ncbi:MAG TPA: rhomboid family intramembrane serine protease [Stellaceae bacterium]|nr:rhomboid family intramembrane serine protease [Stellaceae bacterium]
MPPPAPPSPDTARPNGMDLSQAVFWIAVASSLIMLVRLGRRALGDARSWAIKCVAVLVVALLSALFFPMSAHWIVGGLWAGIVLLPSLLVRLAIHALGRQRYGTAGICARLLGLLHPFDGWAQNAEVIAALRLAQRGNPEQASALLSELLSRPGLSWRMYASLRMQLCRIEGDWRGMLLQVPADDPSLLAMRLRALGETGHLRELVAEGTRLQGETGFAPHAVDLVVLAFCGRMQAVKDLLEGSLAGLPSELKRFWIATAGLAAGNTDTARVDFERLQAGASDRSLALYAGQRLRNGLASPELALDQADWRMVAVMEARSRDARRQRVGILAMWRGSYVIAALIAANIGMFVVEILLGGSEDMGVLGSLGAMWAGAVIEGGEWWRLGAATFLHSGFLHIGFNMAALAILGPWVERNMGHWRTLGVYLLSGIGSTVGVLLLIRLGWMEDEILVGASGAIFGLVGAQLVLRAQSFLQHRSAQAAQRLGDLAWGIALQVVFDFATPQVSFAGHASGLAAGLLLTLALTPGRWRTAGR